MPIISVQNGYIYKKSKKSSNRFARFVFLVFLCSTIIISFAFFAFSKFDLASKLNLNSFMIFESKSYYAVSVFESDDYSTCFENANDVKLQGGAGYVFAKNNKYYLIAHIYKSKIDAENVCQNIEGFEAKFFEVKLDRLTIKNQFSAEQISVLKQSLQLVDLCYENLSKISHSLDLGEIFDAEARQKLQVFKESCQQTEQTLHKAFQNVFENVVINVKIFNSEVISSITMLGASQNLSSDVKYVLASIMDSFTKLQSKVKA